jgi:hypothetical protein
MSDPNTVAIVSIAVSGGVALLATIVAPVTAHFRQRRSLAAEAERQERQLRHDRLLRDLEETRTRVDEVIDMGEAALSAVCEARLAFNGGNQRAADDQLWQARNCLGQYGYKERRVRLRVGNDDSLIARLDDFRVAVQRLFDLAHEAMMRDHTPVPLDAWRIGMARVSVAQRAVIEAGAASIGAQLR